MSKFLNSGITMSDVMYLLSGLESIHECRVELTVRTAGLAGNSMLDTTALAWVPTVEAQQTKTVATVTKSWPDKQHPTYDSFVFNLLYDLDREIGRAYMQEEIPAEA
jgi:hypothetical protein